MAGFRSGWLTCALLVPALVCAAPTARVIVKLKADSALVSEQGSTARASSIRSRASTGAARMQALGVKAGVPLRDGREIGPRMHVAQAIGMGSDALAAHLARQPDVEYAVVDELRYPSIVPDDSLYAESVSPPNPPNVKAGQWYLRPSSPGATAAINAETAWDASYAAIGTIGSTSVVVAVLDSGVRSDHEDFPPGKVLPGFNFVADVVRSGGVNRVADAEDRGDWLTQEEIDANPVSYSKCKVAESSSWHGTGVSGVIGAETNNGLGMASVGGLTKVLPVRVLGKCGGYDSDIMNGMRWAAGLSVAGVADGVLAPRAKIINLSLGSVSKSCSAAYRDTIAAVTQAGVVVVAAAGNEGKSVDSPANCDGVIAVAALRHEGTKVDFSSIGPEVTISAPGGNCVNEVGDCLYPIITTSNFGTTHPVAAADDGSTYTYELGTSFAAPMVSGTVALMFAVRPDLTPSAVKAVLKNSARPFPTSGVSSATSVCVAPTGVKQLECYCTTTTCGAGMLDAGAAVAQAIGVIPVITMSTTSAVAGQAITFGSTGSMPSKVGSNISSYQWALVDDGGIVSALPTGGGASSTLVVTPSTAGQFVISLTLTDDRNQTATSLQTVVVAAAPMQKRSGGGAVDLVTLLFGAVLLLATQAAKRRP